MTPAQFVVWEWLDDEGKPVFVGRGKIRNSKHPATVIWEERLDPANQSHLTRWLCSLAAEPKRSDSVPTCAMHQQESDSWFYIRRAQLKELGIVPLSTRPFGTTIGGGTSRAVVSPEGDVYTSVRDASRSTDISTAMIVRLCKNPKSKWSYLDEIPT